MKKIKKSKITLNDAITQQLNDLEDNSALDVFSPKVSMQSEFQNYVDEAIEQEDKMSGRGKKKSYVVKDVKLSSIHTFPKTLFLLLVLAFFIFVFVLFKIML